MKKKLRWSKWTPLDENYKMRGDIPECYPGHLECPGCRCPMVFHDIGPDGYFECEDCEIVIDGNDAMNGEWDKRQHYETKPMKCLGCNGPYPLCRDHCTLINS